MASSAIVKTNMDGSLIVKDSTGAISCTVRMENGDFSMSERQAIQQETQVFKSRGRRIGERKGEVIYPTFTFTVMMPEFSSLTANSVADAIMRKGAFAAAVSASAATGDTYTTNWVFKVEGTELGDTADHIITMNEVEATIAFAEGSPNTFTISGTVYGAHDWT